MKDLIVILFIAGFIVSAAARDPKKVKTNTFRPGWLVGAGGGVSWYFAEGNDFVRNRYYDHFSIIDNGGFKVRATTTYDFTALLGLRESLGYTQNRWPDLSYSHTVKSFGEEWLATDLIINLSNLTAGYQPYRKFDVLSFAGPCLSLRNKVTPGGDPWFNVQGHAGMEGDLYLSPQLNLTIVAEANVVGDKHNDIVDSSPFEILLTLSVGFSCYFNP